jgi:hypothetical protein
MNMSDSVDVPSTINKREGSELLDVSSDEGDVIQEGQEDPEPERVHQASRPSSVDSEDDFMEESSDIEEALKMQMEDFNCLLLQMVGQLNIYMLTLDLVPAV